MSLGGREFNGAKWRPKGLQGTDNVLFSKRKSGRETQRSRLRNTLLSNQRGYPNFLDSGQRGFAGRSGERTPLCEEGFPEEVAQSLDRRVVGMERWV